jgi:SAM-dependent methyltransferase
MVPPMQDEMHDEMPGQTPGEMPGEVPGEVPGETLGHLDAGTREHYEDAALYDHEYRGRRHDVRWYRRLAAELAEQEGDASLRILELGCGSGRLLVPLARDGHRVCGVDRSAAMLKACKSRLSKLNARTRARVHILQGDFRSLPLAAEEDPSRPGETGRFPLVICPFNGFMHLYTTEDVERCLAEVRRLLAPGGIFALDVVNPDPVWLARNPTRRFARTPFRHPTTGERLVYSTSHAYEPATQVAWIRLYYEPDPRAPSPSMSPSRIVTLAHRLFFPAELDALLHYNGFEVLCHAGGFPAETAGVLDGEPLSIVSAEQVICARVR